MASVRIQDILDHLSTDIKKALKVAIENSIDDADFDEDEMFREFNKAVGQKCNTWESVPEHLVDAD